MRKLNRSKTRCLEDWAPATKATSFSMFFFGFLGFFFSPQLPIWSVYFKPFIGGYFLIKSHLQRSWRAPSSNDFVFVSSPVALLMRGFSKFFISTQAPNPSWFSRRSNLPESEKVCFLMLPNIQIKTSWWLNQPIWKIWVKLDHFPKVRGEKKITSCQHPEDVIPFKNVGGWHD